MLDLRMGKTGQRPLVYWQAHTCNVLHNQGSITYKQTKLYLESIPFLSFRAHWSASMSHKSLIIHIFTCTERPIFLTLTMWLIFAQD